MKYIVLLFLFLNLSADDDKYSLRIAHGWVTDSNFGEAVVLNIKSYPEDLKVTALDGGYLLKERLFDWPFDLYLKSGLSYFDEAGTQDDIYEITLYIKIYQNIDFLNNRVRIGFGSGGSFTSNILYYEKYEAEQQTNDNTSKFLNYLDFSIDVDIGKLVRYKPLHGTSLGWAIKHRSGIYGLINNVEQGGTNYNTLYIEKNF